MSSQSHRRHNFDGDDDDDDDDDDDSDSNNSDDGTTVQAYGFVDNPKEVSEFLSSTGAPLTYTDVRNLNKAEGDALPSNNEKIMDDFLSREMLQLSLQDRNTINEEIHGVQTLAPEETPKMLTAALDRLSAEISMIPIKVAYDASQELTSTYVNSADFRLRLLRRHLFNAKKAASGMVLFLDVLLEMFGDFALRRPIQLTDFNREEMQVFRQGRQQLLPYRDRSGRRIYTSVGGFGLTTPLVTRVKIMIYLNWAASDDVESQRKGITSIVWPGSTSTAGDDVSGLKLNRIIFMKRIYESLPIRTCSIHICLPDTPVHHAIRSVLILSMTPFRQRLKFHVGEKIELQYSLKGYGLPIELIPLTDTGNVKTTYLKQWMKLRRILEVMKMTEEKIKQEQYGSISGDDANNANDDTSITTNTSIISTPPHPLESIIECPGSYDVVFRSGTNMACHPGNVRFRCLIESKHEHPHIVSQTTQAELAEQLIEEIGMMTGRFLKWDSRGYWTELKDRLQIHTKVALSIRDYKYKTKAQRNRQTNQSFTYLFQCQDGNKRRKTNNNEQHQRENRLPFGSGGGNQAVAAAAAAVTVTAADIPRSSTDIKQQHQQQQHRSWF